MPFIIVTLSLIVVSCYLNSDNKTPELIGHLKSPFPTKAMAKKSGFSYNDVVQGHSVYMRKCGECHTHQLPDDIPAKDWHLIVPGMAWNSGIEKSDEDALLKYLLAAKKDFVKGDFKSTK